MRAATPEFFYAHGNSNYLADGRINDHVPVKLAPATDFKPFPLESLDVLDYSNRYGALLYCLHEDIGLKSLQDLNDEIRVLHEQQWRGLGYKFNGVVGLRLSPNEEFVAVLCRTEVVILRTRELHVRTIHKVVQLKEAGSTNMKWISNEAIIVWQFDGPCIHVNTMTAETTPIPNIKCTAAMFINDTIVLSQKNKLHFFHKESLKLLKRVSWEEKESAEDNIGVLSVMHLFDLVKINNLQHNAWRDDDIYAVIGIFYIEPDDQDNNNMKMLYFARGNLLEDKVEVRYGTSLYTNITAKDLFSTPDGKKLPFTLKTLLLPLTKALVIGFSKVEKLYLVNISKPFQQLSEMDLDLKYEFKSEDSLIGLTSMANKLKYESEYNGETPDTKMSVDEYKGNLLSVAFRDMDLDFLVPFPVSIVGLNVRGEFTKQYLISMEYALDERNPQRRKKGIEELLKNCPIMEPTGRFDIRMPVQSQVVPSENERDLSVATQKKQPEARPLEGEKQREHGKDKKEEKPQVDKPAAQSSQKPLSQEKKEEPKKQSEAKKTDSKHEEPPAPVPVSKPQTEPLKESLPEDSKTEMNKLDVSSRIEDSTDSKLNKNPLKFSDKVDVKINFLTPSILSSLEDPAKEAERLFTYPPKGQPTQEVRPVAPTTSSLFTGVANPGASLFAGMGTFTSGKSQAATINKEPTSTLRDRLQQVKPQQTMFSGGAFLSSFQKPAPSIGKTEPAPPSSTTSTTVAPAASTTSLFGPAVGTTEAATAKPKVEPDPIETKFKQFSPVYKEGKSVLTKLKETLRISQSDIQNRIQKSKQQFEEIRKFPSLIQQLTSYIGRMEQIEEDVKINELCMNTSPTDDESIRKELDKVFRDYNNNYLQYSEISNRLTKRELQKMRNTTAEKELERYIEYYEQKILQLEKKVNRLEDERKGTSFRINFGSGKVGSKLSFKFSDFDEEESPEEKEAVSHSLNITAKVIRLEPGCKPTIMLPNLVDVKPRPPPAPPAAPVLPATSAPRAPTQATGTTAPSVSAALPTVATGPKKPEPPKKITAAATTSGPTSLLFATAVEKPIEKPTEEPLLQPIKLNPQVSQIQKKPEEKPSGETKPAGGGWLGDRKDQPTTMTSGSLFGKPAEKAPTAESSKPAEKPTQTASSSNSKPAIDLFGTKKEGSSQPSSGLLWGAQPSSKPTNPPEQKPKDSKPAVGAEPPAQNTTNMFAGMKLGDGPIQSKPEVGGTAMAFNPAPKPEPPKAPELPSSVTSAVAAGSAQPAPSTQPSPAPVNPPQPPSQPSQPVTSLFQNSTAPSGNMASLADASKAVIASGNTLDLTKINLPASQQSRPTASFGIGSSSYFGNNNPSNATNPNPNITTPTSGFAGTTNKSNFAGFVSGGSIVSPTSISVNINTSNPLMPAGGTVNNIFGGPSTAAQQPPTTNLFGASATTKPPGNIFQTGSQQPLNIFNNAGNQQQQQQQQPQQQQQQGAPTNIFAINQPQQQLSIFQQNQQTTTTGWGAQQPQQQSSNPFGQQQQQQQGGSVFGQSGFGQQQQQPQQNLFFSQQQQQQQPQQSMWGQPNPLQTQQTFSNPADIFRATAQSHEHQHNKPVSNLFALRK